MSAECSKCGSDLTYPPGTWHHDERTLGLARLCCRLLGAVEMTREIAGEDLNEATGQAREP